MTEMKKLSVFKIEPKKTQKGKTYWVVETSEGQMSVWDSGLMELLRTKAVGNMCELGVDSKPVGDKTYYNIVSLEAVVGTGQVQEKKVDIGESARLRRKTDCMIAAKDLVVAKIIPMDELLDKAQGMLNWVEGNDIQTADQI